MTMKNPECASPLTGADFNMQLAHPTNPTGTRQK